MTDRYYPKGFVPNVGNNPQGTLESTYNEMNECKTHPRSRFPPGYSGHEHGAKQKFGYSIPAPNALPKERKLSFIRSFVMRRSGGRVFLSVGQYLLLWSCIIQFS